MKAIYINGGPSNKSKGGFKWKLYMFLFVFLAITSTVLKLAAPTIVEKWINKNGSGKSGYAYSIRDVELSLSKGQVTLNDVKIFNPKTTTRFIETPNLTIHLNWSELKNVSFSAETMELSLSKDFSSELERIKSIGSHKKDFYLEALEGKIGKLNIIEQKEDQSRTVIELSEVNFKIKEFSLHTINKKTVFSLSSIISDGGKLNLSGKTSEENGTHPWSITGSLKQAPSGILNKIAGDKLPFAFRESSLNAEISAHSENGKVSGEITPDVKILNLIEEKPGIPTQTIARALTDELTFTLPFTLKEGLSFQYADTFSRLKNYRKFAGAPVSSPSTPALSRQTAAAKKSSFWPF